MNYDLITWIEYFIGAFLCCFLGLFLTSKIIFRTKFKEIKWYSYSLLMLFTVLIIINTLIFDNIVKIFGTLLIWSGMNYFIFHKKGSTVYIYSIINYIVFLIGELTFVFLISSIDWIFKVNFTNNIVKSYIANIFIPMFSCMYATIFRNKINYYVTKIKTANIVTILILGIISLFVILSSLFNLYLNNWRIDYSFILNTVIIIGCVSLIIVLINQYIKNKEIEKKYKLLEEYLKTSASLIEKYSSTVHKYNNNLIVLKGHMKSNLKDANDYLDVLLDNYKNKKYNWFSKINRITKDTIRYLIYYKLSKAEDLNLNIGVEVSKEISKIENDNLTISESGMLLDILGEYFDNAIYATNESKKKELNFILYNDDDKLVFEIANTYKEQVDLSMINKNGYTTKGKGHGFGLYDIDKVIKKTPWLKNNYELIDDYFVVKLYVNVKKNKI